MKQHIEKIKEKSEQMIEEEKFEELKKLKDNGDKISLSKVFNQIFHIFDMNFYLFEKEDYFWDYKKTLDNLREDAQKIEEALDDYDDGKQKSSYYGKEKLKELMKKREINDLIQVFFIIKDDSRKL